jgi:uncharacterized protein (TIGR02594 family)
MSKLLEIALSQYGIKEFPGEKNNPEVLKYYQVVDDIKNDEVAWCSAFINWCAKEAGLLMSGKLNARSWLTVGEKIEIPRKSDLVIFWRESMDSWKGHVGIYINEIDEYIYTLGGNQNNMVCIKPYPKHRLLGYRRLVYA